MALWHFLAYFIFTSCLVAGQQTRYVLKGAEVSLNPGVLTIPEDILWMHKGNKVVEFNGQVQEVYDPFTDRITLNWHTAELSITNLGFQDTGDYVLEAMVNGNLHQSEFKLEVIDNVPKPTISCETTDCSSSNMSATLVCTTDGKQPQSSIKFVWSSNGKTLAGSKLTIPLGEKNDDAVYTCTVSNPLSVEEATFTAKDCHSDCPSVAPIIILVIVVIMLVLVGLGILYCKRYNKACFKTDDVEKQTESGVTEDSAEETEPLVNNGSTPSSKQQEHQGGGNLMPNEDANSHKGDTASDPKPAEVDDKNLQDEKPQKGHVGKMRGRFESPGKSKDEPEEIAPPSPFQQSEPTSSSDQKKLVRGEESDKSDADQVGKPETEIPQSVKEPDQAEVSTTSGQENPETLPSPEQPGLEKDNTEETVSPSPSQQSEAPPPSNQNKLPNSDKGDSDAGQDEKPETEDSQSVSNEAVQPGASSSSQDTKSNLETSTLPEQPGLEKNKDKPEENAPPPSDQNKLPDSDKGDSDPGQVGKPETEDSQSVSEAVQPGASSSSPDTESNPETSTSLEQPVLVPACFAKVETDDSEKQLESGATKVTGPPEENEPLVNNGSSSTQQQHQGGSNLMPNDAANSHKGDTDSDPNSAEVDDMNLQDEKPQKGKSKDEPEETAPPSTSQQREPTSSSDQNKLPNSDKGDSDADQVGKPETEDSQSDNEEVQPGASSSSQDTESNPGT